MTQNRLDVFSKKSVIKPVLKNKAVLQSHIWENGGNSARLVYYQAYFRKGKTSIFYLKLYIAFCQYNDNMQEII